MALHSIMALLVYFFNNRDLFLKKYRIRVLGFLFHFPQLLNIAFQSIDISSDLLGCGFVNIMINRMIGIFLVLCLNALVILRFLVKLPTRVTLYIIFGLILRPG